MSTTINPNAPGALPPRVPAGAGNQAPAAGHDGLPRMHAAPIPAGERVQLTDSARAIDAASRAADAPVDARRVEQLRQAIAAGTYHVDPQRVADRMLALERQIG